MAKKIKKESMIKDAVTLCLISLIAALALGFVNELTKDRIALLEAQAKAEAYQAVFPSADSIVDKENNEILKEMTDKASEILAEGGYAGTTLEEACIVRDASGNTVGYVASVTLKGYDVMTLTFGYTTDGVCTGLEFLSIKETPGMGLKADEPAFKEQFIGKQTASFTAVKSGALAENEIDAITGATITTNAVVTGINAGICFLNSLEEALNAGGVQ